MIASTSFGAFSGTTAAPRPATTAGAPGLAASAAAPGRLAAAPNSTTAPPAVGGVPRRGSLLDIQA